MQALTRHLATLEDERRAWGPDYQDHGLLFCWPDGRPLYPDTITEQFGKLVDRARLPHIRLHDVRHTYATMALRAGVNPKIVSTRPGHATVAFTLDTYTADVPELDRAAADRSPSSSCPRPRTPTSRSFPGSCDRRVYRSVYRSDHASPRTIAVNAKGP